MFATSFRTVISIATVLVGCFAPSQSMAQIPDPSQPADNSELSACIDIKNNTDFTVAYRCRTGDTNSWNNKTIGPRTFITHFVPPGEIPPPMTVEFYGSINGANALMSGILQWKMVRDYKKDTGAIYNFRVRNGVFVLYYGLTDDRILSQPVQETNKENQSAPAPPTPGFSPDSPPEPGIIVPALHIKNLLQAPITYQFLTDGGWKTYDLQPGQTRFHWWKIDVSTDVLAPRAQFNSMQLDTDGGTNIVVRSLQWKNVLHPKSKGSQAYHFNVASDNTLEIYAGEGPGNTQ